MRPLRCRHRPMNRAPTKGRSAGIYVGARLSRAMKALWEPGLPGDAASPAPPSPDESDSHERRKCRCLCGSQAPATRQRRRCCGSQACRAMRPLRRRHRPMNRTPTKGRSVGVYVGARLPQQGRGEGVVGARLAGRCGLSGVAIAR